MDSDCAISNILNSFATTNHAFTADTAALLEFADLDISIDAEALERALQNDGRFIYLRKVISYDHDYYITKKTLYTWLVHFSVRLSERGKITLSGKQLASYLSSLLPYGKWSEPPLDIIIFGRSFGFIGPAVKPNHYVFPLAYILSLLPIFSTGVAEEFLYELADIYDVDLNELFSTSIAQTRLKPKEQQILMCRAGLSGEKEMTLQQIGDNLGISRQRVSQIESRIRKKLQHPARQKRFVKALISYVIMGGGSFVTNATPHDLHIVKFLSECIDFPLVTVPDSNLLIIGCTGKDFARLENKVISTGINSFQEFSSLIESEGTIYLANSDLKKLYGFISTFKLKPKAVTRYERILHALKFIDKPAHYTKIAEVHNMLFPENEISDRNIHAALSDEKMGIVWVGARGIYALKEWGYEHPSKGLHDLVAEIVEKKFSETSKPVPFAIIQAEMPKYRKYINPNSLIFAASFNPRLQMVQPNYFIPYSGPSIEEEIAADELDKILHEFETVSHAPKFEQPPLISKDEHHANVIEAEESPLAFNPYQYPPQFFFSLYAFAEKANLINPDKLPIILDVGKHLSCGWQLSEDQLRQLNIVMQEAREAGLYS